MSRTKGSTNKKIVPTSPLIEQTTQLTLVQTEQTVESTKDNFFIPRNYARSGVQPLWATSSTVSINPFTADQIATMLKNPYANYKQLQLVSEHLINTNSNYNNIVDYLSTIMTFDHVLFPFGITENQTTVKNRVMNSVKIISKMNLKNVFPYMLKQAIIYGESFWYDLSDSENTIIEKLPKEICVLSQIDDDNLWRMYIDRALINPTKVYELPEEIQNAYNDYVEHKKPKGKKKINEYTFIPESYSYGEKGT